MMDIDLTHFGHEAARIKFSSYFVGKRLLSNISSGNAVQNIVILPCILYMFS